MVDRLRTILSEGRVEKRTALLIENFQEQARTAFLTAAYPQGSCRCDNLLLLCDPL